MYTQCFSTTGDSEYCKGQCFTKQDYISTQKHRELPSNCIYGHHFCSEILSDLQRLFPYLCEHGYGHNFITNSNALKQLLTAPAPRVPSGDLSSYTTPLHPLQPHFKGNPTAKPQSDTPRNPCMDKPQPSKADGAGQPVPLSLFLPEEF